MSISLNHSNLTPNSQTFPIKNVKAWNITEITSVKQLEILECMLFYKFQHYQQSLGNKRVDLRDRVVFMQPCILKIYPEGSMALQSCLILIKSYFFWPHYLINMLTESIKEIIIM